ncbi:MAG: lysine--tRNA ligase [Erysipelotrichales bacterium]|nr:lysine--tRNA ligase [Erysipelotrichales bacterium]
MDDILNEQEIIRREKLKFFLDKGLDPFGQKFERTHTSQDIKNQFDDKDKESLEKITPKVIIAGRIMMKRDMGKAGFVTLQDKFGLIQAYIRADHVSETEFEIFKLADIGDIIGISGVMFRTKTNELTVKADKYTHLTKALRPLPEKFHGLQDVEEARRRRYVDLIMNEKAKDIAIKRTKIIRAIQRFFDSLGFIEVETPVLHPVLGGAAARPFVTHHNTLEMDFYLRIATELPLKRLLVGGLEAVYEIGRLFRNEGISYKHNPEFTTIEAYLAYSDMEGMMDLVEGCLSTVCTEILGTTEINFQGTSLSLKRGFRRVHMVDSIKELTNIDFYVINDFKKAAKLAKEHHIEVPKHFTGIGHIINAFFEKYVEHTLIQPTFVYGHPVEISPLAKKSTDARFTQRFELFINKSEYANAFTELNDPIDQKERFLEQLKEKDLGNNEANEMDIDFVEALEYGMPPAGGVGIGIDRLIMLLTDTANIRDVILFPHMKNRQ